MHVCMSAVDVQHVGHCPLHAQGHVRHKQACQHHPSDQLVRRLEVPGRLCLQGLPGASLCREVCCTHPHLLGQHAKQLCICWCTEPRSRASGQHASRPPCERCVAHSLELQTVCCIDFECGSQNASYNMPGRGRVKIVKLRHGCVQS